jgi:hypothetical protein
MIAKLARELSMFRLNRYWLAKAPEVKPTAGYYGDARRWLSDLSGVMEPGVRDELVRLA